MKRNIIFFLMIVMGITLCSCGKKESSTNIDISTYSDSNGFFTQTSDIVENQNGYYILSGKDNSDKYIVFLDKSSNESMVLCSKINCNHSLEKVPTDCDSYVGSVLKESLNYYDGYIYYIGYDTNNYECSLYRISASGSEHEMICKLGKAPENSNEYYSYVITDNYVIYSESIGNSDKKNTAVLKLYNLKSKATETLYSYEDNNAKIFDLKITGENILFRQANSDGLFESKLYSYDVKKHAAELISDKVCSYALRNDKNIIYWKSYDGIYENSVESKENVKLYSSNDDTMLGFIACSNEKCYVYNFSNGAYKQGTDVFIGILDKDEISSKIYVKREKLIMPLYMGSDRVIMSLFDKSGRGIGYSLTNDDSIDTNIINCDIAY